jgi:hypothetical protein
MGIDGRVDEVPDHYHGHPGLDGGLERRQIVGLEGLRVMPYDGLAHVRVCGRRTVVWEVLGCRDHTGLLETLDGRSPHPGHKLRVLPIGTVADGRSEARVDDGGEVGVDTGPQELAAHRGGDVTCLARVSTATDLGSGRLRRNPGG